MRVLPVCLLLVLILILAVMSVFAAGNLVFTIEDEEGDDYGPGYYHYPTSEVFTPYKGLFDLLEFSISEKGDDYILNFIFKEITDPWNSRYGFSMPLIEIYIDNEEGGSRELFEEGANVNLHPDYPWNKLVKISGWWIRVFEPGDRNKEIIDMSMSTDDFPWNVEDCVVETVENTIRIQLPRGIVGALEGANIYLLVGSFDPFGLDHFRGVKNEEDFWEFSSTKNRGLEYAPRVIDMLLPGDKNQEEVLNNYGAGEYCTIYPVTVTGGKKAINILQNNFLYIALIIVCAIIIFINKDNIFKHTA